MSLKIDREKMMEVVLWWRLVVIEGEFNSGQKFFGKLVMVVRQWLKWWLCCWEMKEAKMLFHGGRGRNYRWREGWSPTVGDGWERMTMLMEVSGVWYKACLRSLYWRVDQGSYEGEQRLVAENRVQEEEWSFFWPEVVCGEMRKEVEEACGTVFVWRWVTWFENICRQKSNEARRRIFSSSTFSLFSFLYFFLLIRERIRM